MDLSNLIEKVTSSVSKDALVIIACYLGSIVCILGMYLVKTCCTESIDLKDDTAVEENIVVTEEYNDKGKEESDDDSDSDNSSYVYEPGSSSRHISQTYIDFKKQFPTLDVQEASGGLPDVHGVYTSDVDLVLLVSDEQQAKDISLVHELAPYLHNKVDISEENPSRVIYTLYLPNNPRVINLFVTWDQDGMRSVAHRRNTVLLNNYPNIQTVAIWNRKYRQSIFKPGKLMGTEEAWAHALNLNPDLDPNFDPYTALLHDGILDLAKQIDDEMSEIDSRI